LSQYLGVETTSDIQCVEARKAAQHPIISMVSPIQLRFVQPKMSEVLKLTHLDLDHLKHIHLKGVIRPI
jgi:hypothetical protein